MISYAWEKEISWTALLLKSRDTKLGEKAKSLLSSRYWWICKTWNAYQPLSVSNTYFFLQSYQLAEDLGRAFTDRAILKTFIEAENGVTDASLKVRVFFIILIQIKNSMVLRPYLNHKMFMNNAECVEPSEVDVCSCHVGWRSCISPVWLREHGECCNSEERSRKPLQWNPATRACLGQFFRYPWCFSKSYCFWLGCSKFLVCISKLGCMIRLLHSVSYLKRARRSQTTCRLQAILL